MPQLNFWNDAWVHAQSLMVFALGVIGILIFCIIVLLLLKVISKIIGKDIIKILFR